MKNKSILTLAALAAVLSAAGPGAPAARADDGLAGALEAGKFNLDARYRFEYVDQKGIARSAKANTVRARLGYETGSVAGFRAMAELAGTTHIGARMFNDTVNGNARYPVVADPDNAEFNQYWIAYSGLPDTEIKGGRQRMTFDNHRFVGNVGWRQNEQTFEAVRLTTKVVPDLTATYAYIFLVDRIFGEDAVAGDFNTRSHAVNLSYGGLPWGKLVGYAYLLDIDDSRTLSSQSYGARFTGKHGLGGDWSLLYGVEAAWQGDYGNNPNHGDSFKYLLVEPGLSHGKTSAMLGWEVMTGNGRRAFQTPLATLHAFQGWADKFLTTPGGGIQDVYLKVSTKLEGNEWLANTRLTGVYHSFWPETGGSGRYGSEWDAQIARTFAEHFTVGLKYAFYNAEDLLTDTHKLWVSLDVKF